MKTLDARQIDSLVVGMAQFFTTQKEDMRKLRDDLTSFSNLNHALTGEGGDAIKLFYRENHLPLLLLYETTVNQFVSFLNEYNQARQGFDSSNAAFISSSFVEEEIPSSLQMLRTKVTDMVDSINNNSRNVSDIVHLPNLVDDRFVSGTQLAINKSRETGRELHQFDQQQLNRLSAIHQDISVFNQYINSLSNAVRVSGFSISEYVSGKWAKEEWSNNLYTTLNSRAGEYLSDVDQKEWKNAQVLHNMNSVLDYFTSIKDRFSNADQFLIGSRFALTMYSVVLARQVKIHYPKGKPTLVDRFKRNYNFTVRANKSWLASSGYSNPLAKFVRNMQKGPVPNNAVMKQMAEGLKKYTTPSSFLKHVAGFEKNRTVSQTVQKQANYTFDRTKKGVKEVASKALDAKGMKGVAKGIPIVGNAVTVASNFQEFTDPANADKSTVNKAGRFVAGTATDLAAAATGAKIGATIGSVGGPVGIVVGGAVGALVGVTISSKVGGKIKEIGGNALEGAVNVGKDLADKAGKTFKSIGSWFS